MKILGTAIALLGISFSACSQDVDPGKVPSVVVNALQSKFTAATKVDWEKKKTMYEAEFRQDSVEYTVEIDGSGNITRQKQDLTPAQLPQAIQQAISSQYKDYTVDDAEKLEIKGVTSYQVELESRGKKDLKLVFDASGAASKTAFWD